jgi:CheY-like chemotaxis protein
VREIGGLLQVALSKKVDLVFDLTDEEHRVLVDHGQLRQVVMNLITNASEAIGDRPGTVTIRTRTRTLEPHECRSCCPERGHAGCRTVEISVVDTGIGMVPEVVERIFDPFFTTKPTGRGLGLAAVQGIVRSHKGTIEVESTPGVGATFRVLLPRVVEATADELVPAASPGRAANPGATILVVDDEPAVRRTFTAILERSGYRVVTASDGQEGLDTFVADPDAIDGVLLDLSMPKLNGEEVFEELRRVRPDLPVVLSSGYAEQEILDRFGGRLSAALQKPAPMATLLARIEQALGRSAPRPEPAG